MAVPPSFTPPERLLCGPGPTNVDPAALEAMRRPMLGHLDPTLHEMLLDLCGLLRAAYRAESAAIVLPLQATGTSGMETGIATLVEPGDSVIVGVNGYFGRRIAEMARRHGAEVVEVHADWGKHVPNASLLDAMHKQRDARLLAVVHAETSSGVEHPLAELGAEMRNSETLLMADCVTSLGGIELDFDGWGIDYAYSCTQKCLGAPPGMSPIALSAKAAARARSRAPHRFDFDLDLLTAYWTQRPAPTYHVTVPVLNIYALYEVLRQTAAEGLENRWARQAEAGERLQQRVREMDLELLAEPAHQLAPLTAVRVPDGVDGKAVQAELLERGIEVGGGLGPQAPAMWRLGLMGPNAHVDTADRLADAFAEVLEIQRTPAAG